MATRPLERCAVHLASRIDGEATLPATASGSLSPQADGNVVASTISAKSFPPPRARVNPTQSAVSTPSRLTLLTVGHGTASREEFTSLIERARVQSLVDVRSIPGSRRNPQFGRLELEAWIPDTGISYRWEPELGGFRRRDKDSANVALRHPAFRGYADYMASDPFRHALSAVLADATRRRVCVMCAETLWFRCHRRLIADAATLLHGAQVLHLDHRGKLLPHVLTDGVRRRDDDRIVYDVAPSPPAQ